MKSVLVTSRGRYDLGAMIRPFLGGIRFIHGSGPEVRGCFVSADLGKEPITAELGEERTLDVPFLDVTKLSEDEVRAKLTELLEQDQRDPNIMDMLQSFSGDVFKWAAAKFPRASQEEMDQRLACCRSCEFWDAEALNNTGRCKKCGCSTWAKIRIRTSTCPLSRWPVIKVEGDQKLATVIQ